jgi:hypothetical protein
MDLPKVTEQVKLNMKSIQEILIKNRLLEEKVNYLELQIEKMKDTSKYIENNMELNPINQLNFPSLP